MSINPSPQAAGPLGLLAEVEALLDEFHETPLWRLSNAETLELLRLGTRVAAKVASARLRAVREVDTRGTAIADGASSTAGWIRANCRERRGVASRQVSLARALGERYEATSEALASGVLSQDHAQVICSGLDKLPESVDDATLAQAESQLVGVAREFCPRETRAAADRLRAMLDPDGEKAFAAEEARLFAGRGLHLMRTDEGQWLLRATLDDETGQEFSVVLDALSAPKPSSDEGRDPRSAAQRRADGFAQMVALAHASEGLPSQGAERPTVAVLIPYATLVAQPGTPHLAPATFGDGSPMSAGAARRHACDAKILPIVLGSDSQPLDLGRTAYTPTAGLRKAVLIRDGNQCASPGCGQKPRHIHHINHWADGGPTSLDNLVALCGHCHRGIHNGANPWTITAVQGQRPRFTRDGPGP